MKIEQSVALVTGANRGIGRSLVACLARSGASRIYATARDPKALDEVVAIDPKRIVALKLDVTNQQDVEAAAKRAPDVNLLINNAGVLTSYNILSSSKEQLQQDFAVNFFGMLAVVKALLPALERANGAAVANILTVVSLASRPVIGGYSASKAAAFSLTQSLRPELKAKKIDVHTVIPGAVDTDMIRAFPITKTSPDVVADAIISGIGRGDEDILTDPMAKEAFQGWLKNPKELERYFGSL
jgi:NAD(P)-dependent dehydrogenase (short-subunit alcohol dehydrogenase family)